MNKIKRNYHPWIYSTEISKIDGEFEEGQIVDVFLQDGKFFGRGYINTKSKITIRLLTTQPKTAQQIIEERIDQAIKRREYILRSEQACRLIYSESDWLAGLIVDKYDSYIVIQINTLGMDKLKDLVVRTLVKKLNVTGVYEKSDSSVRSKEGLGQICEWLYGTGPEVIFYRSEDLTLAADLKGQKTGTFLDQRFNARAVLPYAKDKACLDVFSYTGNFSLHLLKYGAKHVKLIDYSERSLQIAEQLLKLNGFDGKYELIKENAFDWLKQESSQEKYDLIVLDPPSFAKSASSRISAQRGHKEINLRAMKLLRKPGILVSSCCTQVLSEQDFEQVLQDSAEDCKVQACILYRGSQPADHPVLLDVPETRYLKFYIMQIWRRA
ncbi:class I SAM-dependent rRNA methyltransferase [Thermotoga profunda]|uniref:class I SAM-dependent rRNA methyltransferase n=1 Tax=Thermotoga profunda TaxID=1508420 RepID=UPI0009E3EF1C|nr:class I SAM-dependent rRNA methyltransferase [Thermotoga profunda]